MLDQQIPPVTLDDLVEFQSKHFPADELYAYSGATAANVDDEDDADELGYYEDGTKRTLSDEQIKIFRHSEIHALLRERERLREQSDEESPAPSVSLTTRGQHRTSEDHKKPHVENPESEVQAYEPSSTKRTIFEEGARETLAVKKTRLTNAESADVVRAENEDKGPIRPKEKSPAEQTSFFRRRIISYADD